MAAPSTEPQQASQGTLLPLDRIEQTEGDWPTYLARAVADFLLAEAAPDRQGNRNASAWLAEALFGAQPRTAAAIVRILAGEGLHLDEALVILIGHGLKRLKEQSPLNGNGEYGREAGQPRRAIRGLSAFCSSTRQGGR